MDDIRDVIIIAALIALSLFAFLGVLIVGFAGYKTLKVVRAANRLLDERVAAGFDQGRARLDGFRESRELDPSGLQSLIIDAIRMVRARRKKKSRLQRLRERLPL